MDPNQDPRPTTPSHPVRHETLSAYLAHPTPPNSPTFQETPPPDSGEPAAPSNSPTTRMTLLEFLTANTFLPQRTASGSVLTTLVWGPPANTTTQVPTPGDHGVLQVQDSESGDEGEHVGFEAEARLRNGGDTDGRVREGDREPIALEASSAIPESYVDLSTEPNGDVPSELAPYAEDRDMYDVTRMDYSLSEEADGHRNDNIEIITDATNSDSDSSSTAGEAPVVSLADSYFPTSTHRYTPELTLPLTAGWIPARGQYAENECFVPLPVITFLVDKPQNLKCLICMASPLSVRSGRRRVTDRTPAIMPCGHVAGARCLADYFATGAHTWSCPFCRVELVHPLCGHRVRERVLTADTISSLPRTLPRGGTIRGLCSDCRIPGAAVQGAFRIQDVKRLLARTRAEYEAAGTESAAVRVMECVEEMERAMAQTFHEVRGLRDENFSCW